MTVETQTAKVTANGNGVATSFSFSPIAIFTATNLLVVFTDTNGDETTLSEGVGATDYEVVVSEYPGTGSITYPADGFSTELQTGEKLTIKRVLTLEQTTDLENQGGYFPDVQETAFDKGTMIDLQQQEVIERALTLKLSDGGATPTVQRTASGYLRWDNSAVDIDAAAISTTAAASSDDVPQDVSLSSGAAGTAADFSRDDHVHLLPTVSVAKGGTGATTASAARTALGLIIGTDVQTDLDVPSQAEAEAGTATTERVWTAERVKQAIEALGGLPRSYLAGLGMSNDTDTAHDIAIAVGECRDTANSVDMILSSILTKQIDATWAAGDDAGGMNDGDAVGNSEWFHVFLLSTPTGSTVDAGFDTSLTAAGLLADTAVVAVGHTKYRRIGSVLTDGSANILAFVQVGGHFLWVDPPLDVNGASVTTTASLHALSVPTGLKILVDTNIHKTAGAGYILYASSPDATDEAPSNTAAPLGTFDDHSTADGSSISGIRTNTSSQIRLRGNNTVTVYVATLGWHDERGRDD